MLVSYMPHLFKIWTSISDHYFALLPDSCFKALVMATIHLLILFLLFDPTVRLGRSEYSCQRWYGVICRLESDIQEQIWISMDWSQQLLRISAQQCLNLMFWSFFYACGLRTHEPRYDIYWLDDLDAVGGTDTLVCIGHKPGSTLPYSLGLQYNSIMLFSYFSMWWSIFFRG